MTLPPPKSNQIKSSNFITIGTYVSTYVVYTPERKMYTRRHIARAERLKGQRGLNSLIQPLVYYVVEFLVYGAIWRLLGTAIENALESTNFSCRLSDNV